MGRKKDAETEYDAENADIDAIREKRREKMERVKKAEKARKTKEIVLSVFFIALCVMVVWGLSSLTKKPAEEETAVSETPSADETKETSFASVTKEAESYPVYSSENGAKTDSEAASGADTESEYPDDASSVSEGTSAEETPYEETTEAVTSTDPAETVTNNNVSSGIYIPSWITQDFLSISEYNRPGLAVSPVKNIVIHYVGNAGSSAKNNRDYFEDLARTKERSASSHFVVGLQGEIIQCVPLNEVAYANYPRNFDTISVEVCHPDATGKFSDTTYWTVVKLAAYLLEEFGLTSDDLIRHYDCNGKYCPLYYVEHPEAWEQLKADVKAYMEAHPDIEHEFP